MVTTSKVVAERHIIIVTRSRRSLNEKRSREEVEDIMQ